MGPPRTGGAVSFRPPLLAAALLLLLLVLALAPSATLADTDGAPTFKDWGRRAVYQILTDRFAAPSKMPALEGNRCPAPYNNYCGGTWQGILDQADYIKVRTAALIALGRALLCCICSRVMAGAAAPTLYPPLDTAVGRDST